MQLPDVLTRKLGPLPVIAWAGIGAGAFVVYRLLTGGSSSSSASPSAALPSLPDASGSDGGSSAGDGGGQSSADPGTPPVVAVPTTPTSPGSGLRGTPTTKAGWLAQINATFSQHQLHAIFHGTAAEKAAALKTLSPSQAHALHMYNTLPAAPAKPAAISVDSTAQVSAVKVPSALASVQAPKPATTLAGVAGRPATAASIVSAKFPTTAAIKPNVRTAS